MESSIKTPEKSNAETRREDKVTTILVNNSQKSSNSNSSSNTNSPSNKK